MGKLLLKIDTSGQQFFWQNVSPLGTNTPSLTCSVQFNPLTNWVVRGIWQMIQQRSSSSPFCGRSLRAVLAWAAMSTLWCCPSSISSADYGVTHTLRCPEEWFLRGCCGVWHAWTMQVSTSWQTVAEEVPVDPQGSCPVVGLVLQARDAKFPQALGFESLDLFTVSKHIWVYHEIKIISTAKTQGRYCVWCNAADITSSFLSFRYHWSTVDAKIKISFPEIPD